MKIFGTKRSLAVDIKYKEAVQAANKFRKPYTVKRGRSDEYNMPIKIITRTSSEGKNTRIVAYNQKNGKPVQFSHHYPNGVVFYDNKVKSGFVINSSTKKATPIPKFNDAKEFLTFWKNTLEGLTQIKK